MVLEDFSLEANEYNCGFDDDPHYKICVPTLRHLSMAFNIFEIFGDIDCKLEINTPDRDDNFALPRLTRPSAPCFASRGFSPPRKGDGAGLG